ncbi:LytTR family DNA-binding domain-containing protein [Chitinophaga pendula]|uniref:LytR/AlgR family response regulator transcription factor n=1 Tax=Chitinophaga TaxID=79328 RepID=UPI000BAFE032|nr:MULTISPECIES: LytTR family DNA-binding domain-containing protein [Chitinophaga]ASZ11232.1 hypothetical protein CK934_09775 [Chitinophaga sp. MD30]UCJ05771.1 LytTR family DNA-binding domain-containing protein [Chitinophaga pendula]
MSYVTDKKVSFLIVDDEKEACKNLKNLLYTYVDPDIHIAGIAHTTEEAVQQITLLQPDALFLDIEMPGENAFGFLERIYPFSFEIVFVTAYDEYAIKAFKLNAVDYLLKPIDIPELVNAVRKVEEKLRYKHLHWDVDNTYGKLSKQINGKAKPQQITLKDNNCIEIVDFKHLIYVAANGSYSRIYFQKGNVVKDIILSHSIAEYEELLPPELFFRIHKSYLVNCMYVRQIIREDNPQVMVGDTKLPVGRRRYAALMTYLKNNEFSVA